MRHRSVSCFVGIALTVALCACNFNSIASANQLRGKGAPTTITTPTPTATPSPNPDQLVLVGFEKAYLAPNPDVYAFRGRVRVTLRVRNNGSRMIKAWRATLVIKNSFGETILTSQVTDGTAAIGPGQTAEAPYIWEDNRFISDEPFDRLMAYDASNLVIALTDLQVVTNDAPSPSTAPIPSATPTSDEISLAGFDKTYLPPNRDAFEFSSRVRITLQVHNNGTRNIKAWRATLLVKNTFGDIILSSQLTDGTAAIAPGQTAEASYIWEDNPYIPDEPFDRLMAYDVSNLKPALTEASVIADTQGIPEP